MAVLGREKGRNNILAGGRRFRMGDHRAKRLPTECPICHDEVGGGLLDHLLSVHTKDELAGQVRSYYEANEEDSLR